MSTIVEASVPAAQFALRAATEQVPDATFEAASVVTDGADRATSLLWCSGADPAVVTAALEADESADEIRALTRRSEAVLYRLEWTARVHVVTDLLVTGRGAILDAHGRNGTWTFRVLYPERDAVAAAVEACDRHDVDLAVQRIGPMTESAHGRRSNLTDDQFRTVQFALERGYYDVPRGTTLTALADELGVSHQALSERLRRGHRQLVESALNGQPPVDPRI